MKQRGVIFEILGWYGATALFGGFVMVTFGAVNPDSFIFQFLNFSGALGLGAIAYHKKVSQAVIINAIWSIIALIALVKTLFF